MDRLVRGILHKIQTEELVDKEDIEIYQFGLECMLLKLIHIVSYLLIGICMGEVFSLIVSGSILIPLRRKAGGYHAKTRLGCYIFYCIGGILGFHDEAEVKDTDELIISGFAGGGLRRECSYLRAAVDGRVGEAVDVAGDPGVI